MDTRVVTASATGSAAEAAGQLIAELKRGLAGDEPALVMVFASTEQPLGEVAAALTEAFAGSQVLGASTAGEFTERGDTKGAVCAIAVAVAVAGALKVYAGIGLGVRANPERAVDSKMQSTFVSCGARAAGDAVVIAQIFSKAPLGLGVCHGHTPLSNPLRVTRAYGNVVEQIEGRPAWDVWKEATRARCVRWSTSSAAHPSQASRHTARSYSTPAT